MKTKQYLSNFFEEKKIQFEIFQIHTVHFIDTNVVIENILSAGEAEQTQIANVLRKIDFRNGNVNHFLKYLAIGLVHQYTHNQVA